MTYILQSYIFMAWLSK